MRTNKKSYKIYENRKRYTCVKDLKSTTDKAWYEVSPSVTQFSDNSMEELAFDVINLRSNAIKY